MDISSRRPGAAPGRALVAPFLLTALALGGCRGDGGTAADERLVSDVPELTLVEELRIGSFDDPDLGFSRIGRADVDRDGRIFVSEVQAAEIRVFDAEGRFLHRFGRRGEGPGEFERMGAMGVTGDTVWVVEILNNRVTLFTREGELISARNANPVRILVPECSGYVSPQGLMPDGTFWSWMSSIRCSADDRENDVGENDSIPVPRVRFDATGEIVDTVGWDPIPPPTMRPPPGFERFEFIPPIQVGDDRYRVPTPPRPRRLHWEGLPDGKLVVDVRLPVTNDVSAFLVVRLDLAGDTIWSRSIRYRPTEITDEYLDALADDAARSGPGMIMNGAMVEPDLSPDQVERARSRIRAEMDFPPFHPPVGSSYTTSDGSLWLRIEGQSTGDGTMVLLLGPDGSTRGRMRLRDRARVLWRSGETILVSEPDDFDVPWLVRYRIEG